MQLQVPDRQLVIPRLPRNDNELWWAVQALWGHKIPRTRVCPGHVAPFEAFADAYFARSSVAIWKASRGFGGKSRTLGLLGVTEITLLGSEVSVLGGSAAQSLNVQATSQEAWEHFAAPRHMLLKSTQYDTVLSNHGAMRSLTASQTSVRGPHPQRLRLDEIDEAELAIVEAAQGQPMRKKGAHGMVETQTVMSSTHQYPDKTMTAMLARAREMGWPIYEWCWRETSNPIDGWLTEDEVNRKRGEVPKHMFDTEYDLQEPSVEGRAIDVDAVERCFTPSLGTFTGKRPILLSRLRGREYITGVDWAKEQDMTVVTTYDTTELPWIVVGWQMMNRQPWPYMIGKAMAQWTHFGGQLVHDATGIGNVIDDWMKDQMPSAPHEDIHSVVMSGGRPRHNLFSEYITAIENNDIRFPRIEYPYNEHKYVIVKDLYGSGHPPDSVVSGALPWMLRKHKIIAGGPTGGVSTKSQWDV